MRAPPSAFGLSRIRKKVKVGLGGGGRLVSKRARIDTARTHASGRSLLHDIERKRGLLPLRTTIVGCRLHELHGTGIIMSPSFYNRLS